MASAKNAKPTWRHVKAELDRFDRAGLLGLIKDLHGASRDNEAFLCARLGLGTDPLVPYRKAITHDHDAYAGHLRLQLSEFTPTRLSFQIARAKDKYVEVAMTWTRSSLVRCSASYKLYLGCKAEAPTSG